MILAGARMSHLVHLNVVIFLEIVDAGIDAIDLLPQIVLRQWLRCIKVLLGLPITAIVIVLHSPPKFTPKLQICVSFLAWVHPGQSRRRGHLLAILDCGVIIIIVNGTIA